jgi:hypothetical protein
MRYTKWFASIAVAAGMAVAGTTAASAQDWRDTRHENNRAEWLRSAVARDRARLAEDYRHGNRREIARDRAELDRHEAELRAQYRNSRYDRDNGSNGAYSNGYTNKLRNYR